MATVKTTNTEAEKTAQRSAAISTSENLLVEPPVRSQTQGFDKPMPQFEADLQRHFKFGYYFGLDDLCFKSVKVNQRSGKITRPIKIGNADYIELEALYTASVDSSIEFSIIDQDREYPILPVGESTVRNERIFFGLPLRFDMDQSKSYQIRKDGIVVSASLDTALSANDGVYTITYTPLGGKQHAPIEKEVQLKIVMRLYDEKAEAPFVKSALLRGYGGDALWIDQL